MALATLQLLEIDNEGEVFQFDTLKTHGMAVLKFNKNGFARKKTVYITPDLKYLKWKYFFRFGILRARIRYSE